MGLGWRLASSGISLPNNVFSWLLSDFTGPFSRPKNPSKTCALQGASPVVFVGPTGSTGTHSRHTGSFGSTRVPFFFERGPTLCQAETYLLLSQKTAVGQFLKKPKMPWNHQPGTQQAALCGVGPVLPAREYATISSPQTEVECKHAGCLHSKSRGPLAGSKEEALGLGCHSVETTRRA